MAASSDLVAIVNEDDKTIGQAELEEVHKRGLFHREIFVFVISLHQKEVLLRRKSDDKWTAPIDKHLLPYEDYLQAAQNSVTEKFGISLHQKFFEELCSRKFKINYANGINNCFIKSFIVKKNVSLSNYPIDKTDAVELRYFSKPVLYNLIKEKKWLDYIAMEILKKYVMHELVL